MTSYSVAVWSVLAIASALWTGCSSDDDSAGSQAGAAGAAGGGGSAGDAGTGGNGGSAGQGGAAGQGMFDPSAEIATAFERARQEAAPLFTDPVVRFVEVTGVPSATDPDYANYGWNFVLVGEESGGGTVKGIEVAYPGWTAEVVDAMPMGAYIDESEFPNVVKVSFSQMLGKAAQAGVTPDACVEASTPVGYIVTLRGSTNPTALGWFWEFFCPADQQTHRFDAGTGEKVGE